MHTHKKVMQFLYFYLHLILEKPNEKKYKIKKYINSQNKKNCV